jgi:hypothetical protein
MQKINFSGFFVQFVECAAVFVFGFVINVIRGLPKFNLIASIGGVLYATGIFPPLNKMITSFPGNCASVPIIKSELGVGLGMLIWTTVQIIEGWCIGRFGLLGTHVQKVSNEPMNYTGLVLSICSGFLFVFVRSESELAAAADQKQDEKKGLARYISRTKLL